MAFATTPEARAGNDSAATYSRDLLIFVFVLFFAFGGITSLNDVIIPKLKSLFTLKYGEVMLVQFAFLPLISCFRFRPPNWCGASATCAPRWPDC